MGPGSRFALLRSAGMTPRLGRGLRPDLTIASDHIFECRELLDTDGAAGVQFAGADADFSAHAELRAVGELRRGIPQHDGRVEAREKALRRRSVLGDDALGVV